MDKTLKKIKKKYGEKMSHFCRNNFSTILNNNPKLLIVLLEELFYPNHELYKDLTKYHLEEDFINYIYSFVSLYNNYNKQVINSSPEELLEKIGYTLYECTNQEDIIKFAKYYYQDELLCTFKENRLDKWYVYFAVHKDADKIKRETFQNPYRQDKYGTSVISIQFSKNNAHILSIKNRYNHTVLNPDATFSNNLDNIIPGLTKSFEKYKGMIQNNEEQITQEQLLFEIPGYILASDGRFYKYNYEKNNIYYCPDNIIIDNYEKKFYSKERYLVIAYYIIDLKEKTLTLYDDSINTKLSDIVGQIKQIDIIKENNIKTINIINTNNNKISIKISNLNKILDINKTNNNQVKKKIKR